MAVTAEGLTSLLVERLRNNPSAVKIDVMASFCGVKPATASGWLGGNKPLGGLYTLRLWHLLRAAGIDSPELVRAEAEYPLGAYIGRLLAFGAMSMKEACELCKVQEGAIFRAARTEGRLSKCAKSLDELQAEYGELLEIAEMGLREKLGKPPVVVPAPPVAQVETGRSNDEVARLLRSQDIVTTAEKLAVALAAAKHALTDYTPAERARLRSLMGERGMFELSNAADQLCSERAFNEGGNS